MCKADETRQEVDSRDEVMHSKKNCCRIDIKVCLQKDLRELTLIMFKFRENRLRGFEAVWVGARFLPFLWLVAHTTACTIQTVDIIMPLPPQDGDNAPMAVCCLSVCLSRASPQVENGRASETENWQEGSP